MPPATNPPAPARPELPGNPNQPSTFLTVKEDELKLAAYLGFTNSSEIRQLCLSWPVIHAFLAFEPHADGVRREQVLELVHRWSSQEEAILNASTEKWLDFVDKFCPSVTGRLYQKSAVFTVRILLRLENDLQMYAASDTDTNHAANCDALALLADTLGRPVPTRSLGLPVPVLGPLPGEHRMESINRCYTLLRWLAYVHNRPDERRVWTSKIGSERAVLTGYRVQLWKIPAWMRPPSGPEVFNTA